MNLTRIWQSAIPCTRKGILCVVQALVILSCLAPGNSYPLDTHDPCSFVIDKLNNNDVVLLGTVHQRPPVLDFISRLIPKLSAAGVTHIGLEIASDQQPNIDRFISEGMALANIEICSIIDCPEYRRLFDIIRNHKVRPVALDLPFSRWNGAYTRDKWIAANISKIFEENPQAKIFVIVGGLHTLKNVEWLSARNEESYIPGYLFGYQPHLRVCSIAGSVDDSPGVCDFGNMLKGRQRPVAVDTKGLDLGLRLLNVLAIKPMATHEAVDAVIVY